MKCEYKKHFFEKPLPSVLPSGQEWVAEYTKNCKVLLEYMKNQNCKKTEYTITIYCLADLETYLLDKCIPYTYDAAENWRKNNPKSGYKKILQRLNDIYNYGMVTQINSLQSRRVFLKSLDKPWRELVDEYLNNGEIKNSDLCYVRTTISRFLLEMQEQGIDSPLNITFDSLEKFIKKATEGKKGDLKGITTGNLHGFLLYLEKRNQCSYGLALYLSLRKQYKPILITELPDDQVARINELRSESLAFPPEEFAEALSGFADCLEKHHYSKKGYKCHRLLRFLLFLAMYHLGYHTEIGQILIEYEKNTGVPYWKRDFRILHLLDTYVENGDILPKQNVIYGQITDYNKLPEWCKSVADKFIQEQARKQYRHSTLQMFEVSLSRFLWFLIHKKISSFSEITPSLLEEFSIGDKHKSAKGKNAYLSRIRRFLVFLESEGSIPRNISNALLCSSAPNEEIVNILTEEEQEKALEPADIHSPFDLRNRAMLAIGLLMGIRASDVITIKLSDIDWANQTIRFTQCKTGIELIQPMPVKAGNAIYLYLKYGRNTALAESDKLFIKNRPPYDSLTINTCRRAVENIIPVRENGKKVTFHCLRRTFATNRLRKGCGVIEISELLGHRDTETVSKYLNHDEERMRKCPISLCEAGLEMNRR